MTESLNVFTEELVASYNKLIVDFWTSEMEKGPDAADLETIDFVTGSWGDRKCDLLGKTPKEAIGETLPDEIEFDDIVYMFESFAVKASFEIPAVITDLFFSAADAAEEYVLSVIDNMDLSINGDEVISDEENEKLCIFFGSLGCLRYLPKDIAKDRLFRVFDKCDKENASVIEMVCESMVKCGLVREMTEYIDARDKICEKDYFILEELVRVSDNEEVFRSLKACLKKECEDISMTVQIVSDCDDGRLIPLIRKIARNQLKALYESGHTPYDESDESKKFFLICNAVSRLGGNIDDLLSLE